MEVAPISSPWAPEVFNCSAPDTTRPRELQTYRLSQTGSGDELDVPLFRRGDVLPVPPAAAERLKQCRSVGVARGLRLYHGDQRGVVSILGGEQPEIANCAELQLHARDFEALEENA